MPFPYELYPKAKETHCLNLPEISVSRPPFPGSIRTVDGCFWGKRNNNSYVSIHQTDQVCAEDNSKCFNQSEVFVDRTVPGVSDTCGQICYAACECNTSNGWYPTCQGTDCYKVVDTRYAGKPNAASASRSLSDVASISASGANSGISASAAAKSGIKTASAAGNYTATAASAGLKTASAVAAATGATSGISTLASGATTCYKKKTCSEGGYESSEPDGKKCTQFDYNGYTCYKDCKDEIKYYSVTINKVFDSSCPTNFAAGFNGISSCKVGSVNCSTYENSITVSNVAEGTSYSWTPTDSYSTTETTATYSGGTKSGTVNSNLTLTATYTCSSSEYYTVTVDFLANAGGGDGTSCRYIQRHTSYVSITLNGKTKSQTANKGTVTFTNIATGTYTLSASAKIGTTSNSPGGGSCTVGGDTTLTTSKTITVRGDMSTSVGFYCCGPTKI